MKYRLEFMLSLLGARTHIFCDLHSQYKSGFPYCAYTIILHFNGQNSYMMQVLEKGRVLELVSLSNNANWSLQVPVMYS